MPPQGARRPDDAALARADRVRSRASLDRDCGGAARIPAGRCCIASIAPSTRTRSGICWHSTSTWRRCCRRTIRRTASTTSPTCSACRRRCRSDISTAAGTNQPARRRRPLRCGPAATPIAFRRISRRTSTSKGCRSARSAVLQVRHTFPLDAEYEFRRSCIART